MRCMSVSSKSLDILKKLPHAVQFVVVVVMLGGKAPLGLMTNCVFIGMVVVFIMGMLATSLCNSKAPIRNTTVIECRCHMHTDIVPKWLQGGSDRVPSMVPKWLQGDSKVAPRWFQCGSKVVPSCLQNPK